MSTSRDCGILLHPTSLPGPFAVGDLGPEAHSFIDWASNAGAGIWQVLPLNPPEQISPYGALSAFAGNPLLISPQLMVEDGMLEPNDLQGAPARSPGRVDFELAGRWKEDLLRRAWQRVLKDPAWDRQLDQFATAEQQRPWLEDWTLFCALRQRYASVPWWRWPTDLAQRRSAALDIAAAGLKSRRRYHAFVQLLFFRQWHQLHRHAAERGVRIFGDLPIYVPASSADVWTHRRLFELDDQGRQLSQAGVPPDYFSATGQLWGFPIYRWQQLAKEGHRWWIDRLAANLRLADLLRLDHFRAFAGFWSVPMGEPTAIAGSWRPGPGEELFSAIAAELGELPLVAEDLGEITADVEQLRQALGFPGMRVLQFGFDDPASPHAPHQQSGDCVVYSGTHDNPTTVDWYAQLEAAQRQRVDDYGSEYDTGEYSNGKRPPIHWRLIHLAYASAAQTAIIPAQDLLGLGPAARMNTPGSATGNWRWRLDSGQLTLALARRLRRLAELCSRLPMGQ